MKLTRLIALVSVFCGLAATGVQAATVKPLFQVLSCPAIGGEYDQMIAKLDAIKTAIKKDANCANVELQVKTLQDLVTKDRETVMNIVDASNGAPLTEDQSKIVRDYAENVTKKVAALNDLFTASNYCFRSDQPANQISALAGFVGEASQLVSSLAGPWGAPIAIAGNVIAGFMTGLDAIYKTRAGFDFSKPEQFKTYVNSLCTYHTYREQIGHLLNPAEHLHELSQLQARLDSQISIMSNRCSDCRSIASQFEVQKTQSPNTLSSLFAQEISRANHSFEKPYGTYMLESLGLREWVQKEINRLSREANGYWSDATGRHLLSQAKDDIEDFLITREGPKFLNFGAGQSRKDYAAFQSFVATEGRPLYQAFQQANPNLLPGGKTGWGWGADPMSYFDSLLLNPIDWSLTGPQTEELQYQWSHFRDQGVERFRNAQTTLQVVQTFCEFFRHASLYNEDIRQICTNQSFTRLVSEEDSVAKKLLDVGIWGAAEPMVENNDLYLNRVEALTKTIELRGIQN